ncbi:MAG: FapA family protein, partial [Candidatus Latescibacteria bacterium]|nr:FapA family protein [Candidatus Latescibacterota bacterium]
MSENAHGSESLQITISEDGLQASIDRIQLNVSADNILDALKRDGITHGVSVRAIQDALDAVSNSGRSRENVVVAEGTPPKFPNPPRLEYRLPEELDTLPSLSDIHKSFALANESEVAEAAEDHEVYAVAAEDLLAVVLIDPGEPGTSVKGEPIEPVADHAGDQNPQVQPGIGVALSSDGIEYRAKDFGYAGILDGKVSVLPPVWISSDGLRACYVNLSLMPGSKQPAGNDISTAILSVGVTVGIDKKQVNSFGEDLPKGEVMIPVARGEPPVEPIDAVPEFSFPYQSQAGLILEDGSIDLKERNVFPSVEKDALLVACKPAVVGTPGKTVNGEEIGVRVPIEVELVAGENVRAAQDEEVQQLYSDMAGGASVQAVEIQTQMGTCNRYTVSVRPVAQISGNVDYDTGNIDFKGNVEIKGTVVGGFKVKATGDITVSESVEDDVDIQAEGGLSVGQGIVGENTRIKVAGGITAKYIQDATVQAGGDVVIGSYIRTAHVHSDTAIIVEGSGGAGGGILGGETWALNRIVSKNVGSEYSATTILLLGIEPEIYGKFEKARETAEKADDLLQALL